MTDKETEIAELTGTVAHFEVETSALRANLQASKRLCINADSFKLRQLESKLCAEKKANQHLMQTIANLKNSSSSGTFSQRGIVRDLSKLFKKFEGMWK